MMNHLPKFSLVNEIVLHLDQFVVGLDRDEARSRI